jgi:hypothetical protein
MDREKKQQISSLLHEVFEPGVWYPFAKAAKYLTDHGIRSTELGYAKMRMLLEDIPEYVTLRQVMHGTNPDFELCLVPGAEEAEKQGGKIWETATDNMAAIMPDGGLSAEKKQQISSLLHEAFEPGVWYPFAKAAKYLTDHGIRSAELGYAKMRMLLEDIPEYVTLRQVMHGTNPDFELCLVPGAGEAAAAPQNMKTDGLPDRLLELAFLPPKMLSWLAGIQGKAQTNQQMIALLQEAYARCAAEGRIEQGTASIRFYTGLRAMEGRELKAVLVPNTIPGYQPWCLTCEAVPESAEPQAEPPAAAQTRKLDDQVKGEIYRLFKERLPFETPLHLAMVGKLLLDEGYDKEDFGYGKMKPMFQDMAEFVQMSEIIVGGVPQTMITLRENPRLAGQAPMDEDIPRSLRDEAFLPQKLLAIVNEYAAGDLNAREALISGYEASLRDHKVIKSDGRIIFDTGLTDRSGETLIASLKPSDIPNGLPWYLNYVGRREKKRVHRDSPGKMLERFAFLGSWASFLGQLADKALPEVWSFEGEDQRDYAILQKYIQYTFYRLNLEDKICISEDGRIAAFNTGLVDEHYDDIYACFMPNLSDVPGAAKWRFQDFCTAGGRGTGKWLVDAFNPLPQPASYFERKEDLLFDLDKDILPDFRHIIVDNTKRLPLDFLREEFHGYPEAVALVDEAARERDRFRRESIMRQMSQLLDENSKLFNRLRNRLQDAIDLAIKQVRWNYKTAIPCFFPTRNVMSLMLPLCLEDDGRADAALVVELTRSGIYQGQTILTLQQAYLDARLVCRPNSEWLQTTNISGEDHEEDEEE